MKKESIRCLFILFFYFQLASLSSFAQYSKLLDLGSNGGSPDGTLISDGTFLYGMTSTGGSNDLGTIFKIKPDGSSFTKLVDFEGTTNGSNPYGSLYYDGNFLYGLTSGGGDNNYGTIFKISTDGTSYTKLFDFDLTVNGGYPNGDLIFDGTFLYGMASNGGLNDGGTIFKIKPDGSGFLKLYDFSIGRYPNGSLLLEAGILYGLTSSDFSDGFGTIFKINPDGNGYTTLLNFSNSQGLYPYGSLITDGIFLYGTANGGGLNDVGTIFKIHFDGTGFEKLWDFFDVNNGSYPYGSLIYDGTFLFGMTSNGNSSSGSTDSGTIFKIMPDGSNFETILDFNGTQTGSFPYGSLISDGTFLYGLTDSGGSSDLGTIFKIKPDGTNFVKLLDFEKTGITPSGSLVTDGTYLYGMTPSGGTGCDAGTIFKIHEDGTGYTTIYNFGDCDVDLNGSNPQGSLLFDGTFLFGMTTSGGNFNEGVIFKILPDGTGFETIYEFVASSAVSGSNPEGSLITDGTYLYGMTRFGDNTYTVFKILKDGTNFEIIYSDADSQYEAFGDLFYDGTFLYGMTFNGGTNNLGNIFRVKPDGTGFSNLFDFDGTNGLSPQGSLISDGTFLYGMTGANGSGFYPYSDGTIFKIMPDGTGYTKIHDFPFSDGNVRNGNLVYDGSFLYGMSTFGGANGTGSIFRINPDGTGYIDLVDFDGANGSTPVASLLLKGTALFGMTPRGGQNDLGTVFKVSLNASSINITQQPADAGICLGQTATLTTAALGLAVSYKWQVFNGTAFVDIDDIPADEESGIEGYAGTDSPILKVTPIEFPRTAVFRCRMFSPLAAEVFTQQVTVTVISGVVSSVTAVANSGCGPGQFMITAFGSTDGDYRWYDNTGALINGQVNSTFITPLLSTSSIFSVAQSTGGCASAKVSVRVNIEDCAPTPGLVWVAQPQQIADGSINVTRMVIDASGNIYAVGYFYGTVDFDTGAGTAILSTAGPSTREYFLMKLSKDRDLLWVESLGTVGISIQISLDGSGNIYLAGAFFGTGDFDPGSPVFNMTPTGNQDTFITKLDTDGNFIWAKGIGGTGTNSITASSVASDANGVYITGGFRGTIDFDPNSGTQLRTSTNTTFSDIFISKLDPSGNFSWAHRMGGTASDGGLSIKVDATGNIYTTGTFQSTGMDFDPGAGAFTLTMGGGTDFYVHKLTNAGIFQWAVKVGGPQVEFSEALALDALGNPHIIGTFGTISSSNQIVDFDPGAGTFNLQSNQGLAFVLKLSDAGTFIWAKNFGGTFGTQPNDITIGASGNILVTGYAEGFALYNPDFDPGAGVYVLKTNINRDVFVTQLDASGNFSWAFNLGSTGRGFENNDGLSIVTDTDGSIYTAGSFQTTSDFDPGHCTFPLFSSNGGSFVQKVKPGVASMCFNSQPVAVTNCTGTVATFNAAATGTTNITYQWQKLNTSTLLYEDITNTGGYSGATTSILVINTNGNFGAGSYQCKVKGDNAPDKVSIAATLNTDQPPPTATDAISCTAGPQTLTASGGTNGNYRWYPVATGGTPITGQVNSSYATPSISMTATYFVSLYNGTCESVRIPVTAQIISSLTAPTTTGASSCGPATLILNAAGGSAGQYRWYDVGSGGTAFAGETNSSFSTPLLSTTTTYYVSINNGTCESVRTAAIVQIDLITPAPTTTGSSNCGASILTLNASGGTNGQYRWYDLSTGGTALAGEVNSSFTTPVLSSTTTYYVSINNGTCESGRTSVVAQIDAIPTAPLTTNNSSCGPAVLTVNASGATNGEYRWYTVSTGGTAISGEVNSSYTTPSINTTTIYFVSNNNGSCESTRTSVVAQINSVPTAPVATSASGCISSPVTLSASGATNGQYRWYDAVTGGTSIAGETNSTYITPALSAAITYYVSIHDGTCESSRTAVLANVTLCATNSPPVIQATSVATEINGLITFSLLSLISDVDNNIDLTKLKIISPPVSGAIATIDANQNLTIDYSNVAFSGTDELTIEVCDLAGSCVQQKISIKVDGDIIIYNGISANGDQQNPIFEVKNIDILESTKNNRVSIFNRWGSKVFETENYNNTTRVFTGVNENGNDLPSGTYYYKIEFSSGREQQTGYLTLKR